MSDAVALNYFFSNISSSSSDDDDKSFSSNADDCVECPVKYYVNYSVIVHRIFCYQ